MKKLFKHKTDKILFLCFVLTVILHAQDKLYQNTFPLSDVILLDGPFKHARDLNIKVLLEYNVDRLLAPYRKEAGLGRSGRGCRNDPLGGGSPSPDPIGGAR